MPNLHDTRRASRRAAALAAAVLLLATATTASADQLPIDGDLLETGPQLIVELGDVAPAAFFDRAVAFTLVCANGSHVDRGQTVTLTPSITTQGDGSATADTVTIGPVPATWPLDGSSDCTGATPIAADPPAGVSLTAPTEPGDYQFDILYQRSLSPDGSSDGSSTPTYLGLSYRMTVVGNTPPQLVVPTDLVLEGDRTGGATAAWTVTATDAEDDPDPIPTCTPAVGDPLVLGTTTVTCSATDLGGMTVARSFDVLVADSTDPVLHGVPDPIVIVTTDADGTPVTFPMPTATDVVDPTPGVDCLPASGDQFPLGTTTVTCTALDDSGNDATATFEVTVRHAAVEWGEPIGDDREVTGSAGRTVPVKVAVSLDGAAARGRQPALAIRGCASAGLERAVALQWGGDGRWSANVDTSGLGTGCHRAALMLGDLELDAFTLRLAGGGGAPAGGASRGSNNRR